MGVGHGQVDEKEGGGRHAEERPVVFPDLRGGSGPVLPDPGQQQGTCAAGQKKMVLAQGIAVDFHGPIRKVQGEKAGIHGVGEGALDGLTGAGLRILPPGTGAVLQKQVNAVGPILRAVGSNDRVSFLRRTAGNQKHKEKRENQKPAAQSRRPPFKGKFGKLYLV